MEENRTSNNQRPTTNAQGEEERICNRLSKSSLRSDAGRWLLDVEMGRGQGIDPRKVARSLYSRPSGRIFRLACAMAAHLVLGKPVGDRVPLEMCGYPFTPLMTTP